MLFAAFISYMHNIWTHLSSANYNLGASMLYLAHLRAFDVACLQAQGKCCGTLGSVLKIVLSAFSSTDVAWACSLKLSRGYGGRWTMDKDLVTRRGVRLGSSRPR